MNLAEMIPSIHNWFEAVVALAFIASQAWQFWLLHRIQHNTNGLVASSVKSANEAGHASGEIAGAKTEQARSAATLAIADEVAAAKLILSDAVEAKKLVLSDAVEAGKVALAAEVAARLEEIRNHKGSFTGTGPAVLASPNRPTKTR
jgi:hypothetical protein